MAARRAYTDAEVEAAIAVLADPERLEEARRTEADARTVTAQARTTAWMVAALPAASALLAELAAPGYLASLVSSPLTGALVAASLVLQGLAMLAIRRIA